jgi:protein TonB
VQFLTSVSARSLLLLLSVLLPYESGQGSGSRQLAAQALAIPTYANSTSGLEHLLKDVLKAQKENNALQAEALLKSLVLPDYESWYRENFDDGIAGLGINSYRANLRSIPAQLARYLLEVQNDNLSRVEAVRFEKDCDDNASELTFALLDGRLKEFPIYDVRFLNGDKFRRLFGFVYVDNGFRFLIPPSLEQVVRSDPRPRKVANQNDGEKEPAKRVTVGGPVAAARLIQRVQPMYPDIARREHLSGTVKLHAIIGKDGRIESLRVVSGRCSLARASVDAVRQWRYTPTLLNGQPVEVDTEIDVLFALR